MNILNLPLEIVYYILKKTKNYKCSIQFLMTCKYFYGIKKIVDNKFIKIDRTNTSCKTYVNGQLNCINNQASFCECLVLDNMNSIIVRKYYHLNGKYKIRSLKPKLTFKIGEYDEDTNKIQWIRKNHYYYKENGNLLKSLIKTY